MHAYSHAPAPLPPINLPTYNHSAYMLPPAPTAHPPTTPVPIAVPPPPPPATAPPATTPPHTAPPHAAPPLEPWPAKAGTHFSAPPQRPTIDNVARYLSARDRKALLAQFTPLAEADVPQPRSLAPFWLGVEAALQSLDPSWEDFQSNPGLGAAHVQKLGPLIVGAAGWALIKDDPMPTWASFRAKVEENFGLSSA